MQGLALPLKQVAAASHVTDAVQLLSVLAARHKVGVHHLKVGVREEESVGARVEDGGSGAGETNLLTRNLHVIHLWHQRVSTTVGVQHTDKPATVVAPTCMP